ncbi:uncharacterized protein LOC105195993 [Solenopsis invicta]|uniref:uncharacterized protein LOC105195993 n=1 Tax=Solenopsis invicta TaxID=13686 RepID=UPI00193CB13A|nr:uncharacterized protein LOC105195993 [Solenopsis invicta]
MLCCVPKRLADGGPFYDEAPFHDGFLFHDGTANSSPSSVREIRIELFPEEDALSPTILLPCAICARTFLPQSLEKHARICERAAAKKRKPFDSAKQRIQGTELAEFMPKQEVRRHHQNERTTRSSWKETHDDFLRTIREARGDVMDSPKQCNSLNSSGAPTRANEKGTCPTCNRQFGMRAYDRHVAWCKDRVTQVPVSQATNLAKERLEARMRYRAPTLKNRRAINREKYSPGSGANQTAKTSVSSPALVKPKESISSVSCNRESPAKQKPAVVRQLRPGQLKDSPTSSGPMKSRLTDRVNRSCFHLLRPEEDHDSLSTSTSSRSVHPSHRSLHFPAKLRINDPVSSNEITSLHASRKQICQNKTVSQRVQNDDARNRETCSSARMQKNIVSARSQGHPRINDVTVNDKILGMIVQPCKIRIDTQKDDQLVTWKQISRKKNNRHSDEPVVDHNFSREFQLLDLDRLCDQEEEEKEEEESESRRTEKNALITENIFTPTDNKLEDCKIDKVNGNGVTWLNGIRNLNQTYLIKDSEDTEDLPSEIFHSKWKPIKHRIFPRIEFFLKDMEDETCDFDQKKLKRASVNDEEIGIKQVKELKVCIENEEDTVVSCTVEELKINDENNENNRKINNKEIEEATCKTEELKINNRDEEKRRASYEKTKTTECNIEKIDINTENTKEIEKMDDVDIAESDRLSVHKEDEEDEDRQTAMDKRIDESTKIEQNLSEPDQLIKSVNVTNSIAPNVSKKKNFIDNSQDYLVLKDEEIPQCNIYDNSLELKESTITFTCNQPNVNEIAPLNDSNNQADCNSNSEDETPACQTDSNRNSLDLTKNIKEISFSASSRIVSPEKNCARNAEKIEIIEERYEIDLTNNRNKRPKRNSKRLNSEVYSLSQNSEIAADNYPSTLLRVKSNRQFQENGFRSDNFENVENNTKDEKADFNTDSDNSCVDDKSRLLGRSIIKTEVMTGEGWRKKNVDSEFDYGSDNTARVGECNARDANGLESSITLTDYAEEESRYHDNEIFMNASVNFPKRVSGAARRAARERPVNPVEMKHKIREKMNLLRDSTNSLISSVEFVELASIRRPDANCGYERETIEIIRPRNRSSKMSKDLPDIKSDAGEAREDAERSYWKRTSKISRDRLTDFYPAYCAEYKFVKRNPGIRILPPVLNPFLINRRKIELETRPAWCNYVRRRPDFNLVLKARTGACKDYDPFLLAEQQMNDLLSDTSDQSMIGSPKLQQTRDNLYPLSHSSAFVKYPSSDKRTSLIAPPTEFDDLLSNFSSDSTETNSISREVFLKSNLAGKDATDTASPKSVRQLGRRVIIDKSKALGVDEHRDVDERRGVVSADRPRKIFDKVILKNTKPLMNRSNSIRASSAPRINSGSDRKTLSDMRKVQGSRIAEGQRSSDQNLNQRNNNYSSMSGSNLSLNSIISSSEPDVKRSNSMFDELITSFEENAFPGLRSFLNNESFDLSSPGGDRQRNGSLISDEELSSPDSYKPQDHSKISNDSAYSSLNRKYSHHGRSANDVIDRLDEDAPRNETSPTQTTSKCKLSKFCHECGQQFPETAKFCCECGMKRLAF